jgi:hypothetical protein
LSGGGVGGADDEGREDMEWVGDGVGGVDENIALAGAKWTRLIVAVGSELLKLNIDMYIRFSHRSMYCLSLMEVSKMYNWGS